jgi:hypothetical protein
LEQKTAQQTIQAILDELCPRAPPHLLHSSQNVAMPFAQTPQLTRWRPPFVLCRQTQAQFEQQSAEQPFAQALWLSRLARWRPPSVLCLILIGWLSAA